MMNEFRESEDDFIPISALEHFSYCPRQWALIHREQTYDENLYTLRGTAAHERVDDGPATSEDGLRVERRLPLWSERYGLIGRSDVVEFRGQTPYPVEYKLGSHSGGSHGEMQLCAQAIALEEMTGQEVPRGALYVVSTKQRREVEFTPELRASLFKTIEALRVLTRQEAIPPPVADARCPKCSLIDSCLPKVVANRRRLATLRARLFVPEDEL